MRDGRGFTHLLCGEIHVRAQTSDDEAIAALASRQQGIAGRRQLLDLAVSSRAIEHRLRVGRLRPHYAGVYAVGHEALPYAARTLAAVMSVAPEAAASGLTAAALWRIADPPHGPIHVVATEGRRPRRGVAICRSTLPVADVRIVDGIPVTSVPRTLLDLSARITEGELRRLVKQAEFTRLTDGAALEAILDRYPRRRGRGGLARIVRGYLLDAGMTRSELEDRFLAFCAKRGLQLPETNVVLEIRGDCMWREARLIVELDGHRAHGTDQAFHDDRARDRALIAAGWSPMRVTWTQLHGEADTLAAEIRDALDTPPPHARGSIHPGGG